MVPVSIGGGVLQPSINSLITKQVSAVDVGGILGISSAFYSGANAIASIIGGSIFQLLGSIAPFVVFGLIMLLFVVVLHVVQTPQHVVHISVHE